MLSSQVKTSIVQKLTWYFIGVYIIKEEIMQQCLIFHDQIRTKGRETLGIRGGS